MDAQVPEVAEGVQVAAKPRPRTYTAEYKHRILKEADACTTAGAIGALLRREGLYSSYYYLYGDSQISDADCLIRLDNVPGVPGCWTLANRDSTTRQPHRPALGLVQNPSKSADPRAGSGLTWTAVMV